MLFLKGEIFGFEACYASKYKRVSLASLSWGGFLAGLAHVVLVGASIITNAQRAGVVGGTLPELERMLADGRMDKAELVGRLASFVLTNPKDASAELNTFLDLVADGYEAGMQQWIYLLFSDTMIGEVCAEVLKSCLEEILVKEYGGRGAVSAVKVPGLGKPDTFCDGLANLFSAITGLIRRHRREGDRVYVHATGGFKPEAAIAVLAANSPGTGAPVFYVHEHFRKVIRIPAMPIKFRRWEELTSLIGNLAVVGSVAKKALESRYGKRTVEHVIRLGWAEEKEGEVYPTEVGKVLWNCTEKVWSSSSKKTGSATAREVKE
ncbi:MAG: putative CRISPR-associated protein [Candidatus Jordarchaeales archaeon]